MSEFCCSCNCTYLRTLFIVGLPLLSPSLPLSLSPSLSNENIHELSPLSRPPTHSLSPILESHTATQRKCITGLLNVSPLTATLVSSNLPLLTSPFSLKDSAPTVSHSRGGGGRRAFVVHPFSRRATHEIYFISLSAEREKVMNSRQRIIETFEAAELIEISWIEKLIRPTATTASLLPCTIKLFLRAAVS
jgi:hypothetical protein